MARLASSPPPPSSLTPPIHGARPISPLPPSAHFSAVCFEARAMRPETNSAEGGSRCILQPSLGCPRPLTGAPISWKMAPLHLRHLGIADAWSSHVDRHHFVRYLVANAWVDSDPRIQCYASLLSLSWFIWQLSWFLDITWPCTKHAHQSSRP